MTRIYLLLQLHRNGLSWKAAWRIAALRIAQERAWGWR